MSDRTRRILCNIGIDPDSGGPHVNELAAWIESSGIKNMGVIWGPAATSDEAKARTLLAAKWEMERCPACQTEILDDYPIHRRFDLRTGRWRYQFRPQRILPLVRDWARRAQARALVTWDRLRGITNPYLD